MSQTMEVPKGPEDPPCLQNLGKNFSGFHVLQIKNPSSSRLAYTLPHKITFNVNPAAGGADSRAGAAG